MSINNKEVISFYYIYIYIVINKKESTEMKEINFLLTEMQYQNGEEKRITPTN